MTTNTTHTAISAVRAADESFFSSLVTADAGTLKDLLTDDFVLISVMDGARIPKSELVAAVGSGQLKFSSIDPAGDPTVRVYGNAAIVSNDTVMSGEFGGESWETKSRYAHVFVQLNGAWKMASAQGTPLH